MKGILLGSLALVFASETMAVDGNFALDACQSAFADMNENPKMNGSQGMKYGYCFGLLEGVQHTLVVIGQSESQTCLPRGGISNMQSGRIFVKYLQEHPASLHLDASWLAYRALSDAYPCK